MYSIGMVSSASQRATDIEAMNMGYVAGNPSTIAWPGVQSSLQDGDDEEEQMESQ